MRPRQYVLTFAAIAAGILIIELIVGDKLSSSVVFIALCIAAGGTLGVSYRRHRLIKR
jgi:uncharacterized membrane protein